MSALPRDGAITSDTPPIWLGLPPPGGQSNLRVALVSLNWWRLKDPRTPLGSAYLCSWLLTRSDLKDRVRVCLIDHPVSTPVNRVVEDVIAASPDIVGIGVYVWNNTAVRTVCRTLRLRGFAGTIALGGPEISYGSTELAGEFPDTDYLVKGEGEPAIQEIVRAELEGRIANGPGIFTPDSLSFEGQAHLPADTEPVQPQSVPELLPVIVKDGFGRIEFQRGCIFACSFCAFPFKDRVFRQQGLSTLRSDLTRLREAGVKELAILDPIFFLDRKRALTILNALDEELPEARLEIQSRLEHLDGQLIERISRMNAILECGVQSLDPVVQRAIKRGSDPHVIEASLSQLRDSEIGFETHLIFGLPFQTVNSLLSDVEYLLDFRPSRLRLFPLLDHRGTDLSTKVQTTYQGRLKFSNTFPREIEETEWMNRATINELKRLRRLLDECSNRDDASRLASTIPMCLSELEDSRSSAAASVEGAVSRSPSHILPVGLALQSRQNRSQSEMKGPYSREVV